MLNNNLSIIFGEFGSGKTYEIVQKAYEKYKKENAIIISNMWLSFPHIRIYDNKDLLPILDEIGNYHKEVITPYNAPSSYLLAHNLQKSDIPNRPIFILIDEGVIFFESRNFAQNFREEKLRNMFATPRHFDMQICVIVQNFERVDKLIRDLSQEIIEIKKFLWFFRVKLSYDTNRIMGENGGLRDEIPILERKWSIPYFSYKRDTNKFFGGLYYTKEALASLAIRPPKEIKTLKDYLDLTPKELQDWRKIYQQKIAKDFLKLPEKMKEKWLKDYENR